MKLIKVANSKCYSTHEEYPYKLMKQSQAFFDNKNKALLVPMVIKEDKIFVPFHLYTIKNVALNIEKSTCFLRVNFHTP